MKRILVWTFVFVALSIGVFLGLRIKSFAKEQLLSLLETEIKASTPCHLETESIDISFLSLSAKAKNVAMVCGSTQKILVKKIIASFSLRDLLKHQILLDLGLHDGFVEGFGPESEAFRFIYYLAEPIPPEKDRPDRWRVKLMNMDVSGVSVREKLGNYVLIVEGGSLEFKKDNRDFITLIPSFDTFYAKAEQEGNEGRIIQIGKIRARMIS